MSDNEKVSDLRIVCYGQPQVKEITVKTGSKAGSKTSILSFRGYHPNVEKKADGSFENKDPDWYGLEIFEDKAEILERLKNAIKDGLVLRVSGEVKTHSYTDKNGAQKEGRDITVKSIAADLKQKGLSINFQKPVKKES